MGGNDLVARASMWFSAKMAATDLQGRRRPLHLRQWGRSHPLFTVSRVRTPITEVFGLVGKISYAHARNFEMAK